MAINELQIFENSDLGKVRTMMIDGMPYFVGKDVTDILGYNNASKALIDHVDEEDKLNNESLSSLGQRGGWLINESGLYSLILSSKMPNAKKFKRWVTSEVLPSIRKNGSYIKEKDSKEKDLEVVDRLYKFAALNIPEHCKELCTLEAVKLLTGTKPELKIEVEQPKLFIETVEYNIRFDPGAEYSTESVAREYGMRAYDLNRRLALMDIQSRQGDRWVLSPEYRFRSYRVYGNSRFWTPVGVRFIYNTLKSHGILPLDERIASII